MTFFFLPSSWQHYQRVCRGRGGQGGDFSDISKCVTQKEAEILINTNRDSKVIIFPSDIFKMEFSQFIFIMSKMQIQVIQNSSELSQFNDFVALVFEVLISL